MAEKNIGKITQIVGAVLDIKFSEGKLPEIHEAINIYRDDEKLGLQIVHHHAKHKRIAVKQRRNEVVAAQQRIVHYGVDFRAKHLACL